MGEDFLKFWRWLLDAVQQATIAEAPAVMTAAGLRINRNTGEVEYNHLNDKGVKQLRSNLAEIGEAGITAPGAAEALELGYNILRHPKQTYGFIKDAVTGNWVYTVPENASFAYRRMGPLERDWLMSGNELSTRATNELTEIEALAARAAERSKQRVSLFKASAEHGGRKQFAKGQPWHGNTTTYGKELILAIPGKNLPWKSGRHYHGPLGNGFGVGDISFEEAPFGSHIDLPTINGYSGVNPSQLEGSVIYSPYNLFGKDFGYRILNFKK